MLKNNLVPRMNEVRMDKVAVGVQKIKNTKLLRASIVKEVKRARDSKEIPYIAIADEAWEIKNCSYNCDCVKLFTKGIWVNINFHKKKHYSYSLYFDVPGSVLAYNGGREIIQEIIGSLRDDYGVEVIDSERLSIVGVDICCDIDISIEKFHEMVKTKSFDTRLKNKGEVYNDIKILPYDFTEESKDSKGDETVTPQYKVKESAVSINIGSRSNNQCRIYDKEHDCKKNGKRKLYSEKYNHCTRFECSLDAKALRTFIKPDGGKIETYDDVDSMLNNLYYTYFTEIIKAKHEYKELWSKVTNWMLDAKELKRGKSKKQYNPLYDMNKDKIQFNSNLTKVRNRIQLTLQQLGSDDERYGYLSKILMRPEDSLGKSSLFRSWVEHRNQVYGDISRDPKVAAMQIRDGLFVFNKIVTKKGTARKLKKHTKSSYTIVNLSNKVQLKSGHEYIEFLGDSAASFMSYNTALSCHILSDSGKRNLNNSVASYSDTIDFHDLRFEIQRLLIETYKNMR